jgi:hypothetical protein
MRCDVSSHVDASAHGSGGSAAPLTVAARVASRLVVAFSTHHLALCLDPGLDLGLVLDFRLLLGTTRSGSFAPPVSRFHSSKVWFEILPSTRSWANFLRWAWLLNGIGLSAMDDLQLFQEREQRGAVIGRAAKRSRVAAPSPRAGGRPLRGTSCAVVQVVLRERRETSRPGSEGR